MAEVLGIIAAVGECLANHSLAACYVRFDQDLTLLFDSGGCRCGLQALGVVVQV